MDPHDLKKNTFEEIWNSKERQESCKNINLNDCPNPCTFNGLAKFLWDVKQTEDVPHKNYF